MPKRNKPSGRESQHERLVRDVLEHPFRHLHTRWSRTDRDALLGHSNARLRDALSQLELLREQPAQ